MATYSRFRVSFEKGEGAYLWDTTGRRYLDFLAGIAVNSVGHCHPAVVEAIQDQAAKLLHVSNLYYISWQAELAELMCCVSGMEKAFFTNSGAEANECALKIARQYAKGISIDKVGFVGCRNSFHGRTLGTLTLTGQEKYQKAFTPLVPSATIIEWDSVEELEAAVNEKTCAILIEPIQGEGGVRPASPEFLQKARELADRFDAMLIFDEVQTGCGRTGTFYAFQGYDVEPDIVTSAKAMGGGFPIGACLAKGKAASVFQPGDHGTTYGGGPLACRAAYAAVKAILDEKLTENAVTMGAVLREGMETVGAKYGCRLVRGRGLMLAMALDKPVAREIVQAAFDEGLLMNATGPDVIRFVPPLIINRNHVEEALQILDNVMQKVMEGHSNG